VLLHSVSSFSKDTMLRTAGVVLQGIKLCIADPGPLRNEIMTSPDFWVILRTLAAASPECSAVVFEILESGVSGSPPAIMADNYEAAIGLLNEFASAASVGAALEQDADRKQQRKHKPHHKGERPKR
jgi:brefeldin A-resistance guanine nucleotide exchange factor 1